MNKYLVIPVAILIIFALILGGCSKPTPTTSAPPASTAAPATTAVVQPTKTAAQPTTAAPTQPAAAPITMKINYTMPKGAGIGAAFDWFGPEFEKRTNGRYKVEIYPSGTLLAPPATLDGIKKGIAQMSLFALTTNPGFPLTLLAGLPQFGFQTTDVDACMAGSKALIEFLNLPELQKEWKDIQLVWPAQLDRNNLLTRKKEVRVPADFKGMKIGGSGYVMEIVNANGGATVTQMPPDIYMNLEKGNVNGSITGLAMIHDYHLTDVVDYYLGVDLGSGMFPTIINKEFYANMSDEDKKIFNDLVQEFATMSAGFTVESRNNGLADLKAVGKSISTPTAAEQAEWVKAAEISKAKWKDDCIKAGVDAATADKVYASWSEIYKKYSQK